MTSEACVDDLALSRQAGVVKAGAAPGPAFAAAAEQRSGKSRRSGGVADPHLAEADEIGACRHRIVAGRHGVDEFGFGHGLLFREIAGGCIELQRDHAQACADGFADLIDGSAASLEIRHHLGGDRGGIGRDAARHHAMIAGEDQDRDIVEARRFAALPAPEPGGKLLEPAEASLRLGQARLAFGNRRCRAVIAFWEVCKALAQVGETGDAAHASFAIFCWPARPSSRAMAWKNVPVTWPRRPPLGPRPTPSASNKSASGASLPASTSEA